MAVYNSGYTGAQHDTYVTKEQLINLIYPVGAIYISYVNTSPATLFGGTWTQIQDRFLLCAGSTYSGTSTGGAATHTHTLAHTHTTPATTTGGHTLTVAEMPSHTHAFTNNAKIGGVSDRNTDYGSPGSMYGNGGYYFWWFGWNVSNSGGGGSHTHPQVATTTNSQSTSTTSSSSNLPPYLAVYVWRRTA